MFAWIAGAWSAINSKFLHISIWIGVTAMVFWNVYVAGINKQKVAQSEKEKVDAEKRNKISAEVDATDPRTNRDRLHDRWTAR